MTPNAVYFPCPSCGASQLYSPNEGALECPFCQTQSTIENEGEVHSFDFQRAPRNEDNESVDPSVKKELSCKKCGVGMSFEAYQLSSHCTHCATPIVTEPIKAIEPDSIIPFSIGQKRASELFRNWAGSRWFAPSAFAKYLDEGKKLEGYYFPHWNYDSDTTTSYSGQRGDYYYVTVTKTVVENGQSRDVQTQERRTEWSYASGTVSADFKDVVVTATKLYNRSLLDSLGPWSTGSLKLFKEGYLSGFESQEHTIDIDSCFENAKNIMGFTIDQKIRADIGGDEQRIDGKDTRYYNIAYKSTLYPVWTASFKWNGKLYEYAINGATGKVVGERPYSYFKIAALVIGIILAIAAISYFSNQH